MEPGAPPDRISDLYHRALECTPDERGAFLEEACAGDAALRGEVESLLRYEPDSAPFLETPAAVALGDSAGAPDRSQMVGRQLGPYTIAAPLGAGGMGEVYRARDSKLGRDVAIKILPSHFTADPERRARFAREARLLAALNHPHIGAIYGLEETDGVTRWSSSSSRDRRSPIGSRAGRCRSPRRSRSRARSPKRSTRRTRKASSIAI